MLVLPQDHNVDITFLASGRCLESFLFRRLRLQILIGDKSGGRDAEVYHNFSARVVKNHAYIRRYKVKQNEAG